MNRVGKRVDILKQISQCIKEAKIKESIFVSPQIKQLFKTPDFKNKLNTAREKGLGRIWKLMQKRCGK